MTNKKKELPYILHKTILVNFCRYKCCILFCCTQVLCTVLQEEGRHLEDWSEEWSVDSPFSETPTLTQWHWETTWHAPTFLQTLRTLGRERVCDSVTLRDLFPRVYGGTDQRGRRLPGTSRDKYVQFLAFHHAMSFRGFEWLWPPGRWVLTTVPGPVPFDDSTPVSGETRTKGFPEPKTSWISNLPHCVTVAMGSGHSFFSFTETDTEGVEGCLQRQYVYLSSRTVMGETSLPFSRT